jgi:peptidoglycan/LPS O-acetylase OafA/YrhL
VKTNPNQPYRSDVQGLRAIAVMLVLAAHSDTALLPGGFVGVDVFFVISGFVITRALMARNIFSERFHYTRFLLARLQRLAPVLLFVVGSTVLVGWFAFGKDVTRELGAALVPAVFFASNLYFAQRDTGYFDELADQDWLIHTWSLGVEAQFYLIWPVALFILYVLVRDARLTEWSKTLLIIAGVALLAVASFAAMLLLAESRDHAFYYPHARAWQFLAGALLALIELRAAQRDSPAIAKSGFPVPAWISAVAFWTGLVMILSSALWLGPEDHYPSWNALTPTLGAALVIAGGCYPRRPGAGWLGALPLRWLGDRSYSVYLWHWPVFVFAGALLDQTFLSLTLALGATLLLAMLSYQWVELPFWKGRWREGLAMAPGLPQGLLVVTAGLVLALFVQFRVLIPPPAFSEPPSLFAKAMSDLPPIYAAGCDRWFQDAELTPCWVGGRAEHRKTAVMLGDSIGAQWQPGVRAALPAEEWNLLVLTKSACPIVDQDIEYSRVGGTYTVCSEWRESAVEYTLALAPDLVIFGSSQSYDFSEDEWRDGTARLLDRLAAPERAFVLWIGNHHLSQHGPQCLARAERLGRGLAACNDNRPAVDNVPRIRAAFEALERERAGVNVLDPNIWACPEARCLAALDESVVVFRDLQHVTATFATAMAQQIRTKLHERGIVASE